MIYFDNAATTNRKPQAVYNAVNNAMNCYSANPGRSGHKMSLMASQSVYNARESTAAFFGAGSYENVVFTANCTMSLNLAMKGLFSRGDHFLISDLEHNSVLRTAYALKQKGVEFDIFKTDADEEQLFHNISTLVKENTKGIVCTHGSNVFGILLPINKIGEYCRKNRLLFIVDAAQTAGIIDINMNKDNINYLCIAPHKGLYAPMGTGILLTDDKPEPLIHGGTGSVSASLYQPDFLPDKYESGTINVPGINGLNAGIKFVKQNKKEIVNRERIIIDFIYEEFKKMEKIILYNKPQLPVLSFNVKNENSISVSDYLNRAGVCVRAGLHCAPSAHYKFGTEKIGTVRVSPSYFNNMDEAKQLIVLMKKY